MDSGEVTIEVATSLTDLARVAETEILAFHGGALNNWFTSPYAAIDPIPESRLRHTTRSQQRSLKTHNKVLVVAKINDEIVGHAHWIVPRRLWKAETRWDKVTAYGINWADRVADQIWPPWWTHQAVRTVDIINTKF